ncbi:MAG: PEP/pyruvate-binding domain-containing protein [Prochloraceae cyanobacterium]|nr:PEP/pyruvate-binding domain-containing protein [Prochloraceae cyanobacterium]
MKKIYWLDRIEPSQRLLVGDKAFNLSQLRQQGYPIVEGFALGSANIGEFIEIFANSQELLADFSHSLLNLDVNNSKELQSLAQQSSKEIINATLLEENLKTLLDAASKLNSESLILRSSICLPQNKRAKFTGLLPSQICACEPEAIELALKQTWAHLFSARNIFFWYKAGISIERLNVAILVQPIADAIASGTAEIFPDRIEIKSTWGLGHSIVEGKVWPDFYQIKRGTKTVEIEQLGHKIRAYCLTKSSLEPYLLTEAEQEQYSLDETSLTQLIELVDRLGSESDYIGLLEWTLPKTKEGSIPQFSIVQSIPYPKSVNRVVSPQKEPSMKETQPILQGLAASPGQAIAPIHTISGFGGHLQTIPQGRILVTKSIKPDWLPLLKKAAGVVAEVGGVTSHAAIIARELGIPAIVGAAGATQILKTGELVLLNGNSGELFQLPEEESGEGELRSRGVGENLVHPTPHTPYPNYPIATQLLVNLSQPSSIPKTANLPVDGVGLLRSELMLLELFEIDSVDKWLEESQQLALTEHLTQLIFRFAAAFFPRPLFYRSLDWRSFEFSSLSKQLQVNPHFKHRGTYNYLLNPTLFALELEALARVRRSGYTNVNLILPFVRSLEEFNFCRRWVEQVGLTTQESFKLWIMAEVPSVLFLLPKYVEAGVQGISIGTNDLTELILGTNREIGDLSPKFNALHPAMLEAIEQLIKLAKSLKIPCSICGQAPVEYPEIIEHLVRWGISSISVELEGVERTYQAIARAEHSILLEAARIALNK